MTFNATLPADCGLFYPTLCSRAEVLPPSKTPASPSVAETTPYSTARRSREMNETMVSRLRLMGTQRILRNH